MSISSQSRNRMDSEFIVLQGFHLFTTCLAILKCVSLVHYAQKDARGVFGCGCVVGCVITTIGSSKPDEKEKEASCELPVLC